MSGSSFFPSSSEPEEGASLGGASDSSCSPASIEKEIVAVSKCQKSSRCRWVYGSLLTLSFLALVLMGVVLWKSWDHFDGHIFNVQASMEHLQHVVAAQKYRQEDHKETFQNIESQLSALTKMSSQKKDDFHSGIRDSLHASQVSLEENIKKLELNLKERESVGRKQDLILDRLQQLLDRQQALDQNIGRGGENRLVEMSPSSVEGRSLERLRNEGDSLLLQESPQKLIQLFHDTKKVLPEYLIVEFEAFQLSQWKSMTSLVNEIHKVLESKSHEEVVHTPWENFLDKVIKIRRVSSYHPPVLEQGIGRLLQLKDVRPAAHLLDLLPPESFLHRFSPSIKLMGDVQNWLSKLKGLLQEMPHEKKLVPEAHFDVKGV